MKMLKKIAAAIYGCGNGNSGTAHRLRRGQRTFLPSAEDRGSKCRSPVKSTQIIDVQVTDKGVSPKLRCMPLTARICIDTKIQYTANNSIGNPAPLRMTKGY